MMTLLNFLDYWKYPLKNALGDRVTNGKIMSSK